MTTARILVPVLFSCVLSLAAHLCAAEIPARDRAVVVISIDGFPAAMWADPALPMPTVRKLAENGAVAARMRVSNPSVTWPNHTTLVTGVSPARHGVLFNGLLTRPGPRQPVKVEPWRDKNELIRVPTVYDLAFNAGLTTAHVDWIPTTNSGTFTWEFPEVPIVSGKVEQEMVAAGLITEEQLRNFFSKTSPAWRDEQWTKAAVHIISRHKPNLMLFHLLNTDAINHRNGSGTWASHTAFAYADYCVREVLDALAAAGLKEKATILIVTDHGFKTARRIIRPNAALRKAGLLTLEGPARIVCDAHVLAQGGIAMAYVTAPEKRDELLPQLKELFESIEGVARVLEPKDYAEFEFPTPAENDQMADLVLLARSGYAFHSSHWDGEVVTDVTTDANPGNHGYLNTDPELDGVFIASGYGIKRGVRLEKIDNRDVAPTIASLLGFEMRGIEGKPLEAILERASKR
jgi:predicted AlkP superfamily pyrophosphatase or phosphodiesterase